MSLLLRFIRNRWILAFGLLFVLNAAGLWQIIVLLREARAPLVIGVSPEGETGPDTVFTVQFGAAIRSESRDRDAARLIRVEPAVAGTARWVDARTLEFRPEGPLPMAVSYAVTVLRGYVADDGRVLRKDVTFYCHTPALALMDAEQVNIGGDGSVALRLRFNAPVAPGPLRDHLELRDDDGRALAYSIDSRAPSREARVRTAPVNTRRLQLILSRGLLGVSGNLPMAAATRRVVPVDRGLTIRQLHAEIGEEGQANILVSCNQPVRVTTAADFISIEPDIPFQVSATPSGLRLSGAFAPSRRYRITFIQGLPGTLSPLAATQVRSVYVPDRSPSLRFSLGGQALVASGRLVLPLRSVNVPRAELSIREVYSNNVIHFLRDYRSYGSLEDLSREAARVELDLSSRRNVVATTDIQLRALLGEAPRGVYVATVRDAEESWRQDRQVLLISDLALTGKQGADGVLVWLTQLAAAEPVTGAWVALYSRTNQVLAEAVTDASGLASFGAATWAASGQTPYAVMARHGREVAFLQLRKHRLDTTGFDVGGRPQLRRGYEAFVETDRGLYRPGDRLHVCTVVRGPGGSVPNPFPVQFVLWRPDGRRLLARTVSLSDQASASVTLQLPDYAPVGAYRVEVRLPGNDAAVGTRALRVEDFIPDRLHVTLGGPAPEKRLSGGTRADLTVTATQLFGAPLPAGKVTARAWLAPAVFALDDWSGFHFGPVPGDAERLPLPLPDATLDEQGTAALSVDLPDHVRTAGALQLTVEASVREPGGRAVTTRKSWPVDVHPHYPGVRVQGGGGPVAPGRPLRVDTVVVTPAGEVAQQSTLEVILLRVVWHVVLDESDDGRLRYRWDPEEQPVGIETVTLANGRATTTVTPTAPGIYRLRVREPHGLAASTLEFACGGVAAGDRPEAISMSLDRAVYRDGEPVTLTVQAPFAGRGLFTVETDQVHVARTFDLGDARKATITFPFDAAWGNGVYACVHVVRPVQPGMPPGPYRAMGILPIPLASDDRLLEVSVEAPDECRPNAELPLTVTVKQPDGVPRSARLTVALVDEGIHQLSGRDDADPHGFFYGRRRHEVEAADIYGAVVPEPGTPAVGRDAAPGGGESGYDPRLMNPVHVRRVNPVAIWRGEVPTDEQGRAAFGFTVPAFTGRLRLRVLAVSGTRFGHAVKSVAVRQPLLLNVSLPRFLAPGDECVAPVRITNFCGRSGPVQLRVKTEGPLQCLSRAETVFGVQQGREESRFLRFRATAETGAATVRLEAAMGTETAAHSVTLPIRPGAALTVRSGCETVTAAAPLHLRWPDDWVPGSDRYLLRCGGLPSLRWGAGLHYLLDYPYGCCEQTVSRAFPLLHLDALARQVEPGLAAPGEIEALIDAAMARLQAMQTGSGGFAAWPGLPRVAPWPTVYAAHFLVEAQRAGHTVPKSMLDGVLDYLSMSLSQPVEEPGQPAAKAYSCYVLALAGHANPGWLYRLYDQRAALPVAARFQVASGLGRLSAGPLVTSFLAEQPLPPASRERQSGGILQSGVRDTAIILSSYLQLQPDHPNIPVLVERLQQASEGGRWATTQENAFALLALGQYAEQLRERRQPFEATIRLGPDVAGTCTDEQTLVLTPKTGRNQAEVTVTGEGTAYCYWRTEGVPMTAPAAHDNDLRVRRTLFDVDGQRLDGAAVPAGRLVVVELTIQTFGPTANVVVSDLLPGGFEIENPALRTRAQMPWITGDGFMPERVERRDDRLLLFADFDAAGSYTYRYVVRAVIEGHYLHPPVQGVCMYAPEISSSHGGGTIDITD